MSAVFWEWRDIEGMPPFFAGSLVAYMDDDADAAGGEGQTPMVMATLVKMRDGRVYTRCHVYRHDGRRLTSESPVEDMPTAMDVAERCAVVAFALMGVERAARPPTMRRA